MRLGIDLGGSKIEIAALERDGRLSLRQRVSAPSGDYTATIRTIAELVAGAESQRGETGSVGVGMPGAISPASGLVKNANSTWLNGKPFDRDLGAALGREVRVANDANCFALSEAVDGAGAGKHTVFGVIAGTGVGGGVVVGCQVLTGPHAIAGEWGHNPLPWPKEDELPGPACYCGKSGCVETFLSGPGLARDHELHAHERLAAPQLARRARTDGKAGATMTRFYDRFARSLAVMVNILDPDAVVIGGGLSNIDTLYREVPKLLPRYVFSDVCRTPVLKNVHGDSGGVRGAAWLWPEEGE
jgi:fructokinase